MVSEGEWEDKPRHRTFNLLSLVLAPYRRSSSRRASHRIGFGGLVVAEVGNEGVGNEGENAKPGGKKNDDNKRNSPRKAPPSSCNHKKIVLPAHSSVYGPAAKLLVLQYPPPFSHATWQI